MSGHRRDHLLNQPLPAAVAVGSSRWWMSYRNYPVFSLAWLWRRTLLFGIALGLWNALMSMYNIAAGMQPTIAAQVALLALAGLLVLASGGPALATLVRHRALRRSTERVLVTLSIVCGLGVAYLVDTWTSGHILRLAEVTYEQAIEGVALAINIIVLLGIYLFLGGGFALRAYLAEGHRLQAHRQARAVQELKREKLESDLQLSLLQAQVEPHFLFNTLGTVRSSLRQDPAHAEATLDALCDYLRATIPRLRAVAPGTTSTLDEQLDICRHYLRIMQLRLRERLAFEIECPDHLRRHPLPPFMLLALVENAVKHGIEPSSRGGKITLSAHVTDGRLVVDVTDDGRGLGEHVGQGVGLANIREQLRTRFGAEAALELTGATGGGARARLQVPLETGAET